MRGDEREGEGTRIQTKRARGEGRVERKRKNKRRGEMKEARGGKAAA